jgi:hypothetical protein
MGTPVRGLPGTVERWTERARWLRWADAAVAWGALTALAAAVLPRVEVTGLGVLAALATALGAVIGPVRRGWRPVSAIAGLVLSRRVRPGDRVWCVEPGDARPAVVTGRRRWTVVLAVRGPAEGVRVRRTSLLLLREDRAP